MKEALRLLDNCHLYELGDLFKETLPKNREELISLIWERSLIDETYRLFVDTALNNHYRTQYNIVSNHTSYRFKDNQLDLQQRLEIRRGKEDPSTVRFTRSLQRDGTITHDLWCSPLFTEDEFALFRWGYEETKSSCFFEPIIDQRDMSMFFDFLDDYYKNGNRFYVYENSQKVMNGYFMVNFYIKGWSQYAFTALIEGETKSLKSVHLVAGGKGLVPGLLDETELVRFLTEQSPLRMELLFH